MKRLHRVEHMLHATRSTLIMLVAGSSDQTAVSHHTKSQDGAMRVRAMTVTHRHDRGTMLQQMHAASLVSATK